MHACSGHGGRTPRILDRYRIYKWSASHSSFLAAQGNPIPNVPLDDNESSGSEIFTLLTNTVYTSTN
jgi:hypothetical protein